MSLAEPGSAILAIFPDPGQRYLSWYLFEDLAKSADEDWLARLGVHGRVRGGQGNPNPFSDVVSLTTFIPVGMLVSAVARCDSHGDKQSDR